MTRAQHAILRVYRFNFLIASKFKERLATTLVKNNRQNMSFLLPAFNCLSKLKKLQCSDFLCYVSVLSKGEIASTTFKTFSLVVKVKFIYYTSLMPYLKQH
jgi:hypothetical protein